MQAQPTFQDVPDVSARERRISMLVTRIRKLHWMGLHEDAERLRAALARLEPRAIEVSDVVETKRHA